MTFDLAIIGAGPGGYVAALRASKLGAKVALIEKDEVGGTCLNWGCIPTKALSASAHTAIVIASAAKQSQGDQEIATPATESFDFAQGRLWRARNDFARAQTRKDRIVTELRNGVEQLLKAAGVELIKGRAAFTGADKIAVNGSPVDTKRIMIATGSSWWVPPGLALDGKMIVSSNEALSWTDVPQRLLIVGGGVIGCEFASIFSAFGSKITIIEATPSILPPVERSISRLLARSFKDRGIEIMTDTTVASAEIKGSEVAVKIATPPSPALSEVEGMGGGEGEGEIFFDRVLVCVGRRPNIPPLCKGREGGVDLPPPTPPSATQPADEYKGGEFELTDHGAIKVNDKFETSVPNVYAIGDVTGGWMLAHVASAEGVSCVEQIFAKGEPVNYNAVPSPIFTIPEMASVGMTAEELTAKKVPFKTGRFPYMASGKARCDGETEGMAVVHVDEKGLILGAHFFGKDATMMVAEATLAIKHRLTAHDVGATIHAHPTISEIFAEAALDALGEAIHKANRK
jgi:dihydrolipoamide dehydrogenase